MYRTLAKKINNFLKIFCFAGGYVGGEIKNVAGEGVNN